MTFRPRLPEPKNPDDPFGQKAFQRHREEQDAINQKAHDLIRAKALQGDGLGMLAFAVAQGFGWVASEISRLSDVVDNKDIGGRR